MRARSCALAVGFWLLCSGVLAQSGSSAGPGSARSTGPDCEPREISAEVAFSENSREVMRLLASPDVSPTTRIPVLERFLAREEDEPESVDFVLGNYARLALGNDYLRRGEFEQARSVLSQVRLDSPAGVSTALMLATSHEMQGNRSAAMRWYVRAAERFPANPGALQALLATAEEAARAGKPRLAAGLYERALKKALANIEDLKALEEQEPLADILMNFAKDSGTTVGGQVVREVVQSRAGALPHLRLVLSATEQMACLERQKEALEKELFQVTESGARIGSFETMLKREREAMERRIETLEQQLAESYRSSEKSQLQAELQSTRERLETLNSRQAELAKQREAKTKGPRRRKAALDAREEELQQYIADNRGALAGELSAVMEGLRKQYLDLAGEGQMGKASMMREISLSQSE